MQELRHARLPCHDLPSALVSRRLRSEGFSQIGDSYETAIDDADDVAAPPRIRRLHAACGLLCAWRRGYGATAGGHCRCPDNDLSLPPLNLLGAIGLPLIVLAVALQALHLLRQRRIGERPRTRPPPLPGGSRTGTE